MYRTIVVGCDGSDHGLAAARFAAWLAGRVDARLIVAAAYAHTAHVRTDVGAEEGEERADAEAAAHACVAAVGGVPLVASGNSLAAALHDVARAEDAALLVVGTSERRRIAGTQPGSVTERVLRHSPCPVAVVPPSKADGGVRRLGVAMDDEPPARAALTAARSLAERLCPELEEIVLVHAVPPDSVFLRPGIEVPVATHAKIPPWLRGLADSLESPVPVRIVADAGDAGAILTDRAHDLDLLVMGSRDLSALRRLVLGGVSTHVVRNAPCPVLVELGEAAAGEADDEAAVSRQTEA